MSQARKDHQLRHQPEQQETSLCPSAQDTRSSRSATEQEELIDESLSKSRARALILLVDIIDELETATSRVRTQRAASLSGMVYMIEALQALKLSLLEAAAKALEPSRVEELARNVIRDDRQAQRMSQEAVRSARRRSQSDAVTMLSGVLLGRDEAWICNRGGQW